MRPKVAIITSMPRAERVYVYNEMARIAEVDFRVFYLRRMAYGRLWSESELPTIKHDAIFIPEIRLHKHLYLSPGLMLRYLGYDPTLMIVTQYASLGMQTLMWLESIRHRRWVLWGEPPHVRFNDDPIIPSESLSKKLRKLALLPASQWASEVWATGTRAVGEFREIVAPTIPVKNLPYYSDLERFFQISKLRKRAPHVRFLFCGSLSRRKGADVVAQAVESLSNLNFELIVAGAGPLQSSFESLPDSAKKHVRLLGFVPLSRIPDVYAETDVLIFPSRHDGWGMTLSEGMASGQPVVSTMQTGAAVDLIQDGENGFLISSSTVENVAEAMRWFIEHPERISPMGEQAQQMARNYTHQIGARHFLNMIHSVLSGVEQQ